jgi:hypothetical protein
MYSIGVILFNELCGLSLRECYIAKQVVKIKL